MPRKPKKGVIRGTDDQREVGENIKYYREQMGLTQAELSALSKGKVKSMMVSRYENGGNHMLMGTFFAIVEVFKITPNDLCPKRLLVNAGHLPLNYLNLNEQERHSVDTIIRSFLENSADAPDDNSNMTP